MPKIPKSEPSLRRRSFLDYVTHQKGAFTAVYQGGYKSDSREAASFFQMMDDRNKTLAEVQDYIAIGRMADPFKDWDEIQRIADFLVPLKTV